ncbi:hypothetical protein BGW80DRAFT_1423439, partial [Lactifluus volemus]
MTYITICNCLSDRLCVALIRTHTFLPSSSPSQSVPLISPLLPVRPVYSPQISVSLFLSTFFRPASFRFFWAASSIELLGCNMQTPRCTPITPHCASPPLPSSPALPAFHSSLQPPRHHSLPLLLSPASNLWPSHAAAVTRGPHQSNPGSPQT